MRKFEVNLSRISKRGYWIKLFSGNYDPSVVAIKMYQRPWEFNITEREIIDTAMGNVDVGPKIYKFLSTGKIEEVRIHGFAVSLH